MKRNQFSALLCICIALQMLVPMTDSNSAVLGSMSTATSRPSLVVSSGITDQLNQTGYARIIVGLTTPFQPEGYISSAQQVQTQRKLIQSIQAQFVNAIPTSHMKIKAFFKYIPYIAMTVDTSGLQLIASSPLVSSIAEDKVMHLADSDSNQIIGVDPNGAWSMGYDGAGQTIAILDTGVDSEHESLSGKIVAEACFSTNDPNNFIWANCPTRGETEQFGAGAGQPCPLEIEACYHGTYVAGIAAGRGGSGENAKYSGVARSAKIISIQVTSKQLTDLVPLMSDFVRGLEYVFELHSDPSLGKIVAVNFSGGSPEPQSAAACDLETDQTGKSVKAAIDNLASVNIATIVASGNGDSQNIGYTNGIGFPACISSAISVGATTKSDEIAQFSNTSPELDLLAPGVAIGSALAGEGYGTTAFCAASPHLCAGTSFAAPHVTGAWAILKQKYPSASVDRVLAALQNNGIPILDTRNGISITKPRIQVGKALKALLDPLDCVSGKRIQRVSVASECLQGDNHSAGPAISADGRYIAFYSSASNLVNGDTNSNNGFYFDVFVYDRLTQQTSRVSIATDGTEANYGSGIPSISGDGRFVMFTSNSTNLVSNDTNNKEDVFVRDRVIGRTSRVSFAFDGTESNDHSVGNSISADGHYIAFGSTASNLVSGDTNGVADVFVYDLSTGETRRVSVSSNGSQGINCESGSSAGGLSADGRYIVFQSDCTNLVNGDTNGQTDIFAHDNLTGATWLVSVASDGSQGNNGSFFGMFSNNALSADGNLVVFASLASNLVSNDTNGITDGFVHNLQTGQTERVSIASDGSQGEGGAYGFQYAAISADGRYIGFRSDNTNLVSGDTNQHYDVFVHDRITGQTKRLSGAADGTQGNYDSGTIALSSDGRYVAFDSMADNLLGSGKDTNEAFDVFLVDTSVAISTPTPTPTSTSTSTPTVTPSSTPTRTPTSTATPTSTPPALHLDTIGIFRQSNATFYMRNSNTTGFADSSITFGASTDFPITGDWNGDGIDTAGVYRPTTGQFFLTESGANPAVLSYSFVLGSPGDQPIVGDWDGNGTDGVGVFRPSNGLIYLKNNLTTGFADFTMVLGIPGDVGLAGDWNGDGKDSPGVYRPSNQQFYLTNSICNCSVFADAQLGLGIAGDTPFVGDWDGDGRSGIGVYRQSNGLTYIKNALTTGFADASFVFGSASDYPLAGYWVRVGSPAAEIAPTFQPAK